MFTAGRGGRRRWKAPAAAGAAALLLAGVLAAPAPAGAAVPAAGPNAGSIAAEQRAVVKMNHQLPIGEDQFAVDQLDAVVAGDQQAMAAANADAAAAASRLQDATTRLAADTAALDAAGAALTAAEVRLSGDRAALRSIAVGMYTGQLTDPQPSSLHALEAEQQKIIDVAEVEAVTGIVGANLKRDLATATADRRRKDQLAAQVGGDRGQVLAAGQARTAALARAQAASAALGTDRQRLVGAEAQLASARNALAVDLDALAGPPSGSGGVSLIGGAALDAAQLVGWYRSQGYVDLTNAPISQLAAWYLQAGAQEGIRGDVAFAQAVLETGGFSSPDSVLLNNYAGIGHCDTCAAGWAFPSPHGGVLGQTQLLRIFADGSPPLAPGPVLAALVPSRQGRRGCCPTWESLTGVWATDPTYGAQILGIYEQMLSFALSRPN